MNKIKLDHILGGVLGLLTFYVWVAIVFTVSTSLFAKKELIHGTEVARLQVYDPIFNWIIAGPLPFFVVLGHHFVVKEKTDVEVIRCLLIGFLTWLTVLLILFLVGIEIPFDINIAGGYIVMFLIYLFKFAKKDEIC
jgi:hypothetical protein